MRCSRTSATSGQSASRSGAKPGEPVTRDPERPGTRRARSAFALDLVRDDPDRYRVIALLLDGTAPGECRLAGGADGRSTVQDYIGSPEVAPEHRSGLAAIAALDDVGIVCVPDATHARFSAAEQQELTASILAHCERCVSFGILAAPHQDADAAPRAPADTSCAALHGRTTSYDAASMSSLPRPTPEERVVVGSAVAMAIDTTWQPIHVRRFLNFATRAIRAGTEWVVGAPSNGQTWARVRDEVGGFLRRLWRAGELVGNSAEEAFFVRCDRTTITDNDIANGRVVWMIRVALADEALKFPVIGAAVGPRIESLARR